jgi:hypothetical protein
VNGAEMPAEEELPEPLKALHRRQAFELTTRHWPQDVAQLVQTLKRAPGFSDDRRAWRWAALLGPRATKEEAERIAADDRAKKKAEEDVRRQAAEEKAQRKAAEKAPRKAEEVRATTTSTPPSNKRSLFWPVVALLIIVGLIAFVAMRSKQINTQAAERAQCLQSCQYTGSTYSRCAEDCGNE